MKLTCATAVFNAIKSGNRESLIRCVQSIAALKTEHEHLIYDGASKDGTVELLRELEAKTPGLKVVSEPDTGIYNALNKGVRDAQGDWFYVLGCDDYISDPALMDRMVGELTFDCDVLATAVRLERKDGTLMSIFRPRFAIFTIPCACHQGEVMRTRLARELGGFDEQYHFAADSDMFLKLHVACRRFRYSNEQFAVFVDGGTSAHNTLASQHEHRTSTANALGLMGSDREMMIEKKILPYKQIYRLWYHHDVVIRKAARRMFRLRLKLFLRFVLYPLVVASRPVRRWLNGV